MILSNDFLLFLASGRQYIQYRTGVGCALVRVGVFGCSWAVCFTFKWKANSYRCCIRCSSIQWYAMTDETVQTEKSTLLNHEVGNWRATDTTKLFRAESFLYIGLIVDVFPSIILNYYTSHRLIKHCIIIIGSLKYGWMLLWSILLYEWLYVYMYVGTHTGSKLLTTFIYAFRLNPQNFIDGKAIAIDLSTTSK